MNFHDSIFIIIAMYMYKLHVSLNFKHHPSYSVEQLINYIALFMLQLIVLSPHLEYPLS